MRRLMCYQIILVLTIAMGWASPGWSKIIASDNFESYAVNSYPSSNWHNLFSGSNAKISSQYGVWNSQSFRLEGLSSWSRVDGHDLSYGNRITYQSWVYIPNTSRGAAVGFFKKAGNQAPCYNTVMFNNSGRIVIRDSGYADIDLQAYSANRWYLVIVAIDFNQNKIDVYIDGKKKYSGSPRSSRSNCNTFALATNNFSGSGTAVAYFDNVWYIDNAITTNEFHSSISGIGAFSRFPYTPGRDGQYAEVKLEFPSGLSNPSDIVLHYSHWYSQAAGSANGKIYISTRQQVTPQSSSNDWETFWVGNATNLGTYVGSFTATYTMTDASEIVSSYVQANPSDHYYIAIKNEGSADIGVYVLYLTANSGSSGPYEPNNTMSQAYGPLTRNQWYTAYIENSSDVDWYKISVSASLNQQMTKVKEMEIPAEILARINAIPNEKEGENEAFPSDIEMSKMSSNQLSTNLTVDLDVPSGLDYDLKLYNSSGTQIGSSTNGSDSDEQVVVSVSGGTYYIKIYGYNGDYSTSSSYRVKADWQSQVNDINLTCYTGSAYNYFTPNSVTKGGSFTSHFRVKNEGNDNAGSFKVYVYLSTNSTISSYDTKVGETTVNTLSGGSYRDLITNCIVPTSLTEGNYYVGYIIDPDNSVDESNENDNNWYYSSPQLTVSSGTHTVSTPSTPTGPSTGSVNQSLTFSTGGSSCNQGHSVQYRFDWGNGSYSSWGSSSQGTTYSTTGTFSVRAQARCSVDHSVVSNWSGSKNVTIGTTPGNDIPITPSAATTQQAGTEFDVEIIVGSASKPVSNLYGVSFELGYSTTYIDYVSVDEGGSFLGSNLLVYPIPDESNGKVSVGITRRNTTTGVDGYGSIIKIRFRSLTSTPDNTQISFALHNVTANDPNGNAMSYIQMLWIA